MVPAAAKPAMPLNDKEAKEFTEKFADLCDKAGWDVTGGEAGVISLAIAFGITAFGVAAPRVAIVMAANMQKPGQPAMRPNGPMPTSPASPAEAMVKTPKGGYDLSGLN
jgi:hypothetical protein